MKYEDMLCRMESMYVSVPVYVYVFSVMCSEVKPLSKPNFSQGRQIK